VFQNVLKSLYIIVNISIALAYLNPFALKYSILIKKASFSIRIMTL